MGKLGTTETNYWKKQLEDGLLDHMSTEIDVLKETDVASFLRPGSRSSFFVLPGSGDQKYEKKNT